MKRLSMNRNAPDNNSIIMIDLSLRFEVDFEPARIAAGSVDYDDHFLARQVKDSRSYS